MRPEGAIQQTHETAASANASATAKDEGTMVMTDDRIPDPRDRQQPGETFLPDDHAASLAAFEAWCHHVGARSAIRFIAQYRRAISNHQRKP